MTPTDIHPRPSALPFLVPLCSAAAGLVLALAPEARAQPAPARSPASASFEDAGRSLRLVQALPAIDTALRRRAAADGVPGLAYGVVIDGRPVALRGIGVRDTATGAGVDADTLFPIASLTKSFVALAVLHLRDAGRIELDAPAARYLPELGPWRGTTADAGPVTVRHLLTGMSGLPEDGLWTERPVAGLPDAAFSMWLRQGLPLARAPGLDFGYTNYAYALLGEIVRRVSGEPYEQDVQRLMLRPLGMEATRWNLRDTPRDRVVQGYRAGAGGALVHVETVDFTGPFGAVGGLISSPRDLARWIGWLMDAYPPRDDPDPDPVPRRLRRELQTGAGQPQLLLADVPGEGPVRRAGTYAHGLYVARDCRFGREVSHPGDDLGITAHMRWLPEHGVGVFVLANRARVPAGLYTREMLRLLDDTGALRPRLPRAGAALESAADALVRAFNAGDGPGLMTLMTDSMGVHRPLAERAREAQALRERAGACKAEPLRAIDALRGTLVLRCERGWVTADVSLAPVHPPRLQILEWSALSAEPPASLRPSGACVP